MFKRQLKLGAWSYSIYLFHEIVADVVNRFLEPTTIVSALMFALLSGAITIALASVVYKFIEQPFILAGRKLRNGVDRATALSQAR